MRKTELDKFVVITGNLILLISAVDFLLMSDEGYREINLSDEGHLLLIISSFLLLLAHGVLISSENN